MTRGAGRTRGYRPGDSELRPGKTVIAFGERTTICGACRAHRHQACWAHTAALGLGGEAGCPCGCHVPVDDPIVTDEAVTDMERHGTLAEFVRTQQAWWHGSGPLHMGDLCSRCLARRAARTGNQTALSIDTGESS
ncbi:hypothetical protein [Embleya sp. NPDC005971]|uniref:hypothetical protein n=1 Tax=Embleya sp. NPDC005971 TaxID=3156724 RepID=UPI0033D73E86